MRTTLESLGFKQTYSDAAVYIFARGDVQIILPVFVDDMTFASKSLDAIKQTIADLTTHFKLRDLGPTTEILGIKIDRNRQKHSLTISQRQYCIDMLSRFNMANCKPVTPLPIARSEPQDSRRAQLHVLCRLWGCHWLFAVPFLHHSARHCICSWSACFIHFRSWCSTLECHQTPILLHSRLIVHWHHLFPRFLEHSAVPDLFQCKPWWLQGFWLLHECICGQDWNWHCFLDVKVPTYCCSLGFKLVYTRLIGLVYQLGSNLALSATSYAKLCLVGHRSCTLLSFQPALSLSHQVCKFWASLYLHFANFAL